MAPALLATAATGIGLASAANSHPQPLLQAPGPHPAGTAASNSPPKPPIHSFDAAATLAKSTATNLGYFNQVAAQVGDLHTNLNIRNVGRLPETVSSTQEGVVKIVSAKMPSTDSWLYKNTSFVDNPTIQKIAKIDSAVLSETAKVAPVASSVTSLTKDGLALKVDKLPQDIVAARGALTDYFVQKMPSTDSFLYKATGLIDKPAVQKFIKYDEEVLNEAGKVAPVATTSGSLVRDMLSFKFDKVPGDVTRTRQAMDTYFTEKMPSTDSWLYKHTSVIDAPIMQKFIKVDNKVLVEVGKIAPVTDSAGTLIRDIGMLKVDRVAGDLKATRSAMTDYFVEKMPTTDSWLYKVTNFMDTPTAHRFIKADTAALDAVQKSGPALQNVAPFIDTYRTLSNYF